MLEAPERLAQITSSKGIVEKLKRLQLILGSKSVKKQCDGDKKKEEESGNCVVKLDQLPTELLIQIFSHLQRQDVARVRQTCRRFANICTVYKANFAHLKLDSIAIRYGFWRDVLKQRIVPEDGETNITYCLPNNNDSRFQPKKRRRAGFILRKNKIPFNGIVNHCKFETILLTAEMLNGDLRTALRLKELNSTYIFFDLSHHSLQLHSLQRYLPQIVKDLNSNAYVQNVDFIFESSSEMSDSLLEKIIAEQMKEKCVTVIFLKSRCYM